MDQLVLHIVDRDFRSRGEILRNAIAGGHAAFGYDDFESLATRSPQKGVVLLSLALLQNDVKSGLADLDRLGVWLPVIVTAYSAGVEEAVTAMRGGALDILDLPLDVQRFARVLAPVAAEGERHAIARRRLADARRLIGKLTPREREVLDRLTVGRSNKAIAREMEISPRTVEVHRASMMGKLGAKHPADAVRLRLELGLPDDKGPANA